MPVDLGRGTRSLRRRRLEFVSNGNSALAAAETGCVLRKIKDLETRIAAGGWSRDGVHRLIALVEEDGVVSARERDALETIAHRDRCERFLGRARSELESYLGFVDRVEAPAARSTLFGLGGRDIDPRRYQRHVEILAGERQTVHPRGGGPLVFDDRFVPSPKNQLEQVAEWLEAYYSELGFEVDLEPVLFRERIYFNVVVTIPGKSAERILLCDHYDVADKEQICPRNVAQLRRDFHLSEREVRRRVGSIALGAAVPGADDNASASAALMEMGAVMRGVLDEGVELEKTLVLVHLVGEELPANCLGARTHIARARERGDLIGGVIVLDMIGVDRTGRRKIQISPGRDPRSMAIAAEVKRAIGDLRLDLCAVLRPYGARKSFLHQTDGIQFSKAGIPVVLINEHVNDDHDLHRAGYHDEFDVSALISFPYAADVTRAALETAFRLARPPR